MNFEDIADIQELAALNTPLHIGVTPRYVRKQTTTTPAKGLERKTPKKTPKGADRFIPNRSTLNVDVSNFNLLKENGAADDSSNCSTSSSTSSTSMATPAGDDNSKDGNSEAYQRQLAESLLQSSGGVGAGASGQGERILAFKQKAPLPDEAHQNNLRVLYSANRGATDSAARKKVARHIASAPERILDAPELLDDYYLNLMDWSANNVLAIALGRTVYLWDATSAQITELCTTDAADDCVTSLSWVKASGAGYLAVGTNRASVQLWDVARQKQIREMRGHAGRVGALAWNQHTLTSGSRDGSIRNNDVRVAQAHVSTYAGHTQEVCGLSWSHDGAMLASGGNDNLLNLWDVRHSALVVDEPLHRLTQHQAAVKALAWCPWQSNLLVSGAGTADRHLRFWNTANGSCVNSIDTGSQVCAVQWSMHKRELVSSHGFSQNQLTVWSYPSLAKVTELFGHSQRVLGLAQSPDGQTVCSVSPDETLRFWKIWTREQEKKSASSLAVGGASSSSMRAVHIR